MAIELSKQEQEAIVQKCANIITQGIEDDKIRVKKNGLKIDGRYEFSRKKDKTHIFTVAVERHSDTFTFYVDFILLNQNAYKINGKPLTSGATYVDTSKLVYTVKSGYAVLRQREKADKQSEEARKQAEEQARKKQFNTAMLSLKEISNSL